MTSAYSVGETIYNPRMARSPARSFDAFIASIATPVVLPCTRADFWAQDRKTQGRLKATRFFTSACYPHPASAAETTVPKSDTPPESFGLVCADVDQPEAAAPWINGTAAPIPWAHYIYHTTSSTPDNPRIRILVGVEQLPVSEYPRVVEFLAEFLNIPLNQETRSPLQAMFYPTTFVDEPTKNPAIARNTSAPLLTLAETPHLTESARTYHSGRSEDDPPLAGIAMEHVEDMLKYLPPDCNYTDWCAVCCGLQHQFAQADETSAAAAFRLFDRWSSGELSFVESLKYGGTEATYKKWKAFSAFGKRASITIRSVVAKAKASGWESNLITAAAYDTFLARIGETLDPAHIEQVLIKEVALHELLSPLDRSSLVTELARRLGILGRSVTTRAVTKLMTACQEEAKRYVPPNSNWCANWAYVGAADKWTSLLVSTPTWLTPQGFDAYHVENDKGDEMRHHTFALKNGALRVLDTVYDPTTSSRMIPLSEKDQALNTYRPTYPSVDPGSADEAGEILDRHLEKLFPDPGTRRTLKDWMAWVLQNPGRKAQWAPVVQGTQGCGKSVIFLALGACLGPGNHMVITNEYLTGAYNDWATERQLLIFEEISLTGREGQKILDKLKLLITSATLSVNKRYAHAKEAPSYGNCAFILNNLCDFPMDPNERRYFVVRCAQQTVEDKEGMDVPYWTQVYRLTAALAGGLRHHLLTHRCADDFDALGEAPKTQDMQTAALVSASPEERAVQAEWGRNPCIRKDAVLLGVVEALLGPDRASMSMALLMKLGYTSGPRIQRHGGTDMIWYRATLVPPTSVHLLESTFPAEAAAQTNIVSMFSEPPNLDTPVPDVSTKA